jgi:hypothetical protein
MPAPKQRRMHANRRHRVGWWRFLP